MRKLNHSTVLFYLFMSYILIAGAWWSYLLYIKNQDALQAKKSVLWYEMKEQGVEDETFYLQSDSYQNLVDKYTRQQYMILGEGMVLMALMLIGLWHIYQSRQKEIALAQQQQNFLLSITHELKSPLASIQLALETFQKRSLTPEQTQKLSNHGLRETERLHRHIQDMLLAARVEGGYLYTFEPLDISNIIETLVEGVQPRYKGEIVVEMPDETPIFIQGDRLTLTSAISNVLENAIKYAPQSPAIVIRLSAKSKLDWQLDIMDTGQGIPKQERARVFDKFYRIGNEDTRQHKGTGLGLYITKKVIDAHNGTIQIRDNEPQGCTVSITLPSMHSDQLPRLAKFFK